MNGRLRRRAFARLSEHRGLLVAWGAASVGMSLAHAALALCAGLLARAVATMALGSGTAPEAMLGGAPPVVIAIVGLIAALVKAIAGILVASREHLLSGRVAEDVRLQATARLLAQGSADTTQALLARLATRSGEVERAVRLGALGAARATVQLIPLVACLIALAPRLSVVALGALGVFGLAIAAARTRWRNTSRQAQEGAERLHREIDELVAHVDLWRTYGAAPRVQSTLAASAERAVRADADVAKGRAALSGANEVLAAVALVAATLTVGAEDAGGLLAFVAVFFMAYRPIRALGDARGWMAQGDEALTALDAVAPEGERESRASGAPWAWTEGQTLTLAAFGAAQRGPRTTLSAVGGSIVVLRGATGSGKTTLLRALLGLEPAVGRLAYGAWSIASAGVGPDARPFAWVPQDAPVITASLRENIALAGATADAVSEAIHRLIGPDGAAQLGHGQLGRGGRTVSGGQRRLIAVARALASRQPVLLLDEPTEGLDPDAARAVVDALERLRGARTILIATHRPEVERIADHVLHLDAPAALAAE